MSVRELEEQKERLNLLVLGAAHSDTKFTTKSGLVPGHTSSASGDRSFGGDGCNLASDLRKLGNRVGLITPIGGDTVSGLILRNLQQQGIPVFAMVIPEQQTASYTAIHDANGRRYVAVIARDIYDEVSVKRLEQHLPKFKTVEAVITDSAFPNEIYTLLALVTKQNNQDVYVVLSSLESSRKINPLLNRCAGLFANVEELNHLAENYDLSEKGIWRSLETIASKGTEAIFATHGDKGIYTLVDNQKQHFKASEVGKIVSGQGVGDTFAAAVINSVRKGVKVKDAIREGVVAADLRVQNKELSQQAIRAALEAGAQAQQAVKKRLFTLQVQ